MKRLFAFVLAAVSAAAVAAGCSSIPPRATGPSASSAVSSGAKAQVSPVPTPAPTAENFGMNDTASFNSLDLTALQVKTSAGDDWAMPDSGNVYIGVQFEARNTSGDSVSVGTYKLFSAVYADDIFVDPLLIYPNEFSSGTLDGSLAAGKKMVGWIVVQAPKNTKTIEFIVAESWLSGGKADFQIVVPSAWEAAAMKNYGMTYAEVCSLRQKSSELALMFTGVNLKYDESFGDDAYQLSSALGNIEVEFSGGAVISILGSYGGDDYRVFYMEPSLMDKLINTDGVTWDPDFKDLHIPQQ